MSKRKKKVRKIRPSHDTEGKVSSARAIDNSSVSKRETKTGTPVQVSDDYVARKSIYSLEPFLLPDETLSYELASCLVKEKPVVEEDREKLLEEEIEKKIESQGGEYDEQVDTIPPGQAPNTQVEMKLEMRRSGDFRIMDFNNVPEGMEDEEPSEEEKILEEFKKKKDNDIKTQPEDILVGRIINHKYEIYELIEKGAASSVYRIRDINTDEKFIATTLNDNASLEEKELFEKEISANSKLDHENIARFIESIEEDEGMKFLVLEEIRGISLDDVLEIHGPVEVVNNIRKVLSSISDALEYVHSNEVFHRDLKSDNVILTKSDADDFSLKVLGFAGGENISDKLENISQAGFLDDSPVYEVIKEHCKDEKSRFFDIFALGLIAFKLVSGVSPYPGNSLIDVIINHGNPEVMPVSLSEKAPNLPEVSQLERIILRALEIDPSKKMESAKEFKLVIQDWAQRASSV